MPNSYPNRRLLHLMVQHVEQETLIYDEQTHKAYCLNPVAAAVWNRCDGATSIEAITDAVATTLQLPITEELVGLALSELRANGLLQVELDSLSPEVHSRRAVIAKLGVRAALLLPIIVAMTAPAAAQSYSGCEDC